MKKLKIYKTRKPILNYFLLILLTIGGGAKAQLSGFGAGNPQSNPNWSSGVHYMDETRAEVYSMSISGITACILFGGHSTFATGNTFNTGDICLLIQMIGGVSTGVHQNVRIVSNTTCTGSDIKVQAVFGSILSFVAGGNNRIQLIKINEYSDFTLSGGFVTCAPWDGYTGGVLPMVVTGTLDIDGGYFSVENKGYNSIDGCTYGISFGGLAGNWGTSSTSVTTLAQVLTNSCKTYSFANTGTRGTEAGTHGSGTKNQGTKSSFGGSNKSTFRLIMGDAGYWQNGYGAGIGSQGGGEGGNGADNLAPCGFEAGQAGNSGNDGNPGGFAGKGGAGGGAMIIKAGAIDIAPSGVVFLCGGQNGQSGGNGGKGGMGGKGGDGGVGCCDNGDFILGGGPGGYGDIGDGGQGGDGGNGGKPGYIWLGIQSVYTTTAAPRSNNFNALGGKGGKKGKGGWGNANETPFYIYVENECTDLKCPILSCQNECNVDKAMCILAQNSATATLMGGDVIFKNPAGIIKAKYFSATNSLEAYENICDVYKAKWRNGPTDPDNMFPYFTNSTNPILGDVVLLNTNIVSGCNAGTISYPVFIEFRENSGNTVLTYEHYTSTSPANIFEIGSNNSCVTDYCTTKTTGNPTGDGMDGVDELDGTVDGQHPGDNVIIDENALWKKTPTSDVQKLKGINFFSAKLYPNPANNSMWIELETNKKETVTFTIFDLAGKAVYEQKELVSSGTNKYAINTQTLVKGMYIILIKATEGSSRIIFSIE